MSVGHKYYKKDEVIMWEMHQRWSISIPFKIVFSIQYQQNVRNYLSVSKVKDQHVKVKRVKLTKCEIS